MSKKISEAEVRFVKSTSLADYFAVGTVTVRQSNHNGVICCLTCLVTRCAHITAALPAIEQRIAEMQQQPDSEPGADRARGAA